MQKCLQILQGLYYFSYHEIAWLMWLLYPDFQSLLKELKRRDGKKGTVPMKCHGIICARIRSVGTIIS